MNRIGKRVALALLCLALALALCGCGQKPQEEEEQETYPNPVATITMRSGAQMRFELRPDCAPNTVANFTVLANRGFYDGQEFFRVVSGVLIQGGDPKNDGTGDAGYAIRGEFADNGFDNPLSHTRGTISLARASGYDSGCSQFFIMQGNYLEYDGKYAAFGTIQDEASLAVLDSIASQQVDSNYLPLARQVISTIHVETFGATYKPERLDRKTGEVKP